MTADPLAFALSIVAAYLLGSVSFAIVVSRLLRLPDPRSYGSRNPGATNVLRTGRRAAAALTLAGDFGKGWLAVALAWHLGGDAPAAGMAVFLGHLYPAFHRFQGGKGVATAAGVLFGFNLWLGIATVATWVAIAVFFRYSSLAALVAALFAPVYAWWLFGLSPILPVVAAIALLLIWRHRENLRRLAAGTESRIGEKKASPSGPNAA
ncbi:MAG TPA: glycerol-3-phosphate 1-O-acyltransferase PlsY [Burkholderiales bacterium]|jgi:acyl phosphate:glycerol-3-phosphate acyltransferase|nr:glycerol-3-phosphate 1-O-acyltransferase PlsY [Burkholderiales bacterium]